MERITEQPSPHRHLEKKETLELLQLINQEDQKVALAVQELIPAIAEFVDGVADRMLAGGRLFYIGAGTSGRLGIVDASECPPTYGVEHGLVVGIMAGGDSAMRKAAEFAEDERAGGWRDLQEYKINTTDTLVGIAASGTTPYVVGAVESAREAGILTAGITCNPGSPLAEAAEHPLVAVVGPEFVTGSTRMKSGTAQKLLLNMISTTVMIKLGRVEDNKMVDMQLSNNKLIDRGVRMIQSKVEVESSVALDVLKKTGSVRKALEWLKDNDHAYD